MCPLAASPGPVMRAEPIDLSPGYGVKEGVRLRGLSSAVMGWRDHQPGIWQSDFGLSCASNLAV